MYDRFEYSFMASENETFCLYDKSYCRWPKSFKTYTETLNHLSIELVMDEGTYFFIISYFLLLEHKIFRVLEFGTFRL